MTEIADVILGIDVGTSSVKAACVSSAGIALATKCVDLCPLASDSEQRTQDPKEWLSAINECIEESLEYKPKALGICFNCSTLVPSALTDATPLDHAWLWNDTRASGCALEIEHALRSRGISCQVRPNEPCARMLRWSIERYELVEDVRFWEAATWVIFRLTGRRTLPRSIYRGRWGLLANPRMRTLLFSDFPQIKGIYERSITPLSGWRDCLGHLNWGDTHKHRSTSSVPLFCSGNDGLTAIFGSGYLPTRETEFFLLGTSQLHLVSSAKLPETMTEDGPVEEIKNLDILFGRRFILNKCGDNIHEIVKERIAAYKGNTDSLGVLCLVGGVPLNLRNDTQLDVKNVIWCGRFAGAVGAAAFGGMAADILPSNIKQTSKLIRKNWGGAE